MEKTFPLVFAQKYLKLFLLFGCPADTFDIQSSLDGVWYDSATICPNLDHYILPARPFQPGNECKRQQI